MRSFLQLVCILLLLAAQQGALTHAVWHVGGEAPAHTRGHEHHDGDAPQSVLCSFHFAAATVLGALGATSSTAPALAAACCEQAAVPLLSLVAAEAPPAASRGPPVLL